MARKRRTIPIDLGDERTNCRRTLNYLRCGDPERDPEGERPVGPDAALKQAERVLDEPPAKEWRATQFFAAGVPAPKGSAKGFKHRNTGRVVVTHANKRTKPWEGVVSWAAQESGLRPASRGPVDVSMTFYLPRPRSHMRRDGSLKASAPEWPLGKPDVDKLARLVLDALTGVAYTDDSFVDRIVAEKQWAANSERAGVRVTVRQPA